MVVDASDVRKTDFDACARPCRGVGSILANSRGARKKAKPMRRRAPGDGVIEHLQHSYIHHHTHAHTHTHTQVTSEIHAHAHAAIVYYDCLQLTSSMHEAKGTGYKAHGQKENNACLRAKVNTYSSRAGGRHKCTACLRV